MNTLFNLLEEILEKSKYHCKIHRIPTHWASNRWAHILSRGNEQDWKEECVMWYESSVLIPDAEHLPHFCAEPPDQADSKDPKLRSLQAQTGAVTLNSCGNANRKQGTLEKKV